MKRSMLTAAALAGLLALGCEKAPETPAAPETPKTEPPAAGGMIGAMKDAKDAAADKAAGAMDSAKAMGADATKVVEEIYNKAKAAIDGGKLDEAKGYVDQLQPYLDKVPADWKDKIQKLIADYTAKAAANLPKMGG